MNFQSKSFLLRVSESRKISIVVALPLRRVFYDATLRTSRLDEVYLQVPLQVQVGHLVLVTHLQELRQSSVGKDAPLERGVKAVVGLHILGDEASHLRL